MRKPCVAVVDDDSDFASYLKAFLLVRGYEARCYTRGAEMLASLKQTEPPDVVLLDVMMPGLDGMATLRAIKSMRQETEVIMVSGRNHASTIVEAVQLGAADYLVKSDHPEGLEEIALDVAIKNAIEKTRLVTELGELRQLADDEHQSGLGNGEKMRRIATVIEQVADSDVTVLIRGESGVGKELVARAIHDRSTRCNRSFVKVNCAALPAELLESELFGHTRGAFTGADTTRIGKFEQADGGTLMLDEIGEMKPALQAKMLHVLQDGEFTKLGSNKRIEVDVRVVAVTNRDLEQMLSSGEFRKDLYYRLKVIEILVPPLRERRDEIPTLTDYFIDRYSKKYNRPMGSISDALRQLFQQYDWQGNVRELENMIKRVIILQDEGLAIREIQRHRHRKAAASAVVTAQPPVVALPVTAGFVIPAGSATRGFSYQSELPGTASGADDAGRSLGSVARTAALKAERAAIEQALRLVNWNRRKAAVNLGVSYKTLLNRIKWCGISRV